MKNSNTFIFVPANSEKFLNKSLLFDVKSVIYDLEDSVLEADKENALKLLTNFLLRNEIKSKISIRFNFENYKKEISYLIQNKAHFDYIIIPKFNPLNYFAKYSRFIQENKIKQKLIFMVEDSQTLQDLYKLNLQISDLTYGLMIGTNDLASDLDCAIDSQIMQNIKLNLQLFCKANSIKFIDAPEFDIQDIEKLKKVVEFNKNNGIMFKSAIHPSHIKAIDSIYKISKEEYEKSLKIIELSKKNGAFKLDNVMIDNANIKKALKIIKIYESNDYE